MAGEDPKSDTDITSDVGVRGTASGVVFAVRDLASSGDSILF